MYGPEVAKPSIDSELIYQRAREVLDAEGPHGLTARRLASDLGISTSTLYQRIGHRDELVHKVVARHFAELRLDVSEQGDWESTAFDWCQLLLADLRTHPHLTELMTYADRASVMLLIDQLAAAMVRDGLAAPLVADCSRALVELTLDHARADARASRLDVMRTPRSDPRDGGQTFERAVRWMLVGVRADATR